MAATLDIGHSSSNTPEYQAFLTCFETLILTIKLQPNRFCDSLFAKGYIQETARDYTRNISFLDMEKAEKLLDAVIDQIKHDCSVFYGFIDILESLGKTEVAKMLKQEIDHCRLIAKHKQQRSSSEDRGINSDLYTDKLSIPFENSHSVCPCNRNFKVFFCKYTKF